MSGSDGHIDYEGFVAEAMREAMRGVLKRVLIDVAKSGLPGDHHFYISFKTTEPGVSLSSRLMEKYPDEMTIVLQHRFWDLVVHADRFEVKLQFNSIPERLVVPFNAIRVFVDPSVRFGHQFDDLEAGTADDTASPALKGTARSGSRNASNGPARGDRRRTSARKRSDRDADVISIDDRVESASQPAEPQAQVTPAETPPPPPASSPAPEASESKVISLDKFRKK
jgi:uncharacterized protein